MRWDLVLENVILFITPFGFAYLTNDPSYLWALIITVILANNPKC